MIVSKSYGKIILAGEHSVVYGKPAIIFPIDRFCEVKISVGDDDLLVVPHADRPGGLSLRIKNNTEDKHGIANYVINNFFKKFKIINKENLQIEINSNIPIGEGFGSSAAVITALVKALFNYFYVGARFPRPQGGETPPLQKILDFCVSCENLIHKKSSGADIYATWFGKPIYFQNENGKIEYQMIDFRRERLASRRSGSRTFPTYFLIDTGRPLESTGEMVTKIRNSKFEIRKRNMKIISEETEKIYKTFTTSPRSRTISDTSIHQIINKIENCLENLGVVSEEVKNFIHDLNQQKISAKICGAGGYKKGSGVVIAFSDNQKTVKRLCAKYKYSILNVKILP